MRGSQIADTHGGRTHQRLPIRMHAERPRRPDLIQQDHFKRRERTRAAGRRAPSDGSVPVLLLLLLLLLHAKGEGQTWVGAIKLGAHDSAGAVEAVPDPAGGSDELTEDERVRIQECNLATRAPPQTRPVTH